MKHKKKLITIILILLLCQVGLIYIYLKQENINFLEPIYKIKNFISQEERFLGTQRSYFMTQSFYDQAYKSGNDQIINATNKVYGGIIPHHLMPKDKIAAWFMGLQDKNYETVVLIGPNHYEAGNSDIIISQAKWKTPYGELLPNLNLSDSLLKFNNIKLDEQPFKKEHSISGLVPFIKKSLPDAKIVPIILKYQTSFEDLNDLANNLNSYLDKEKTLVLASVDFSHFQTDLVSDFHDDLSQNVIETFDFERIHNLEIDSPASIYTILKYLEKIDSQKAQLVFHTNSNKFMKQPDISGTSHFYYYFSKGEIKENKGVSFMFFGDLMLDRDVKTKIDKYGLEYIFNNLATDENRFFMGSDVVSVNLEGALSNEGAHYLPKTVIDFAINPQIISEINKNYFFNFFNIANNHLLDQGQKGLEETKRNLAILNIDYGGCPDSIIGNCSDTILNIGDQKIAMLGFSMIYNDFDLDQAKEKIIELKNNTDLIITQIHWGVEYEHNFNKTQQNIAHQLVDAGTDIIIGHHPHVVQGIEIYNDKPIFYSLGNFVFDQYFSKDTQEELGIGIFYKAGEYKIYFFPIQSKNSQLELMINQAKEKFFSKIINWSNIDKNFQKQLQNGYILIK